MPGAAFPTPRLLACTSCLLWLLAGPSWGQGQASSAPDPEPYVFALAALEDAGMDPGSLSFLSRFPKAILSELDGLPPRFDDPAYDAEVGRKKELASRFTLGAALLKSLDDAAAVPVTPGLSFFDSFDKRAGAAKAVEKARADLGAALETTVAASPSPGSIPVKPWAAPAGGLLELKGDSALRAGRKQGIDLVITGTARSMGKYVTVTLSGIDTNLGRQVFLWRGYADPADPEPLAADFADRLLDVLAASQVAALDIAVVPPSAKLLIDGEPQVSASLRYFLARGGSLDLEVWAPGRRALKERVELAPDERRDLSIELEEASYGQATVKAEVDGASLSVAGREAPLGIPLPLSGARDIAVVSAPDRETAMAVLPPSGAADITLDLRLSDGLGPGGRAEKAKNEFYFWLGMVAVGLPAASVANGFYLSYEDAGLRASFSGGPTFQTEKTISSLCYWGATAFAAFSASIGVFKLIDFLKTVR